MSPTCEQIFLSLQERAIPAKVAHLQRYFNTGPGGYGEGDLFLGVTVPEQRQVAKNLAFQISLAELSELLQHSYHEMRLTGLFALDQQLGFGG